MSWQGGVNYQGTVQALTEDFIAKNWTSRHPGVEVTTVAGPGSNGNGWAGGQTFAAAIAGDGPDIVVCCCTDIPSYQDEGLLVPLDGFLTRDNINPNIYPRGIMQSLTTPAGIVQLPDYIATVPLWVNLGALDELGLPYPEPDWSYTEATKLWEAAAGVRKGKQVYGAGLGWHGADGASLSWLVHGWGGSVRDTTHTRCVLDSPESVAAMEWLVPLIQRKVVIDQLYPTDPEPAVFQHCGSWEIQWVTLNLNGLKWDFLPTPVFPKGRSALVLNGSYGISAFSNNPQDLVWDLFKFMTVDKRWQQFFNARLAFATPNQLDPGLWADWGDIVRAVAPGLRGKHLEYYQQIADAAWGWDYFRYQAVQADGIINKYAARMVARQISVTEGALEITRRINALEAIGPRLQQAFSAGVATYERYVAAAKASARPIEYPPPSRDGAGAPPSAAPKLVATGPGGELTVRGAGGGVRGTADGCTLAAAAYTRSAGSFTCRLTSISAPHMTSISNGAKVGLMARGALGASAAFAAVAVALGRGVHFEARPVSGSGPVDQRPASSATGGGLVSATALLADDGKPATNYLLKPIWLRLALDVSRWTAFTSWDGVTWTQAGSPVECEFVGAWVGVFVTSRQSGQYIQAVFDHATGFTPNTFVQVGQA